MHASPSPYNLNGAIGIWRAAENGEHCRNSQPPIPLKQNSVHEPCRTSKKDETKRKGTQEERRDVVEKWYE